MSWINIVYTVPVLLVSVILHEVAHGKAAELLGDPTARRLGRITLNPIKHIDPFMTVLLPAVLILSGSPVIFGGAKPVPVNPLNFKHPRQGMALVAIAGPITNFILAGVSYLFFLLINFQSSNLVLLSFRPLDLILPFFLFGIVINLVLALFNLLPVPPLDGGRIMVGVLPLPLARLWSRLEPVGLFIVVALIYLGVFEAVIEPVLEWVFSRLLPAV